MTDKSVSSATPAAGSAAGAADGGRGGVGGGAEGLLAAAKTASVRGPAPVHLWNPPFCGDLDMEIRADGTWFYNGTPIARPEMVRLFSTILKREGDAYFLVTPVEKIGIRVIDAPFIAVDCDFDGDRAVFTTNVGERIAAGPENGIRMAGTPDQPRPYLHIRAGLEALIDRKTFYRLAEVAETDPASGRLALRSDGHLIVLEP